MDFKRLYNSINYKGIIFGHLTKIKELFSQTYFHVSVDCVSELVSWLVNIIFCCIMNEDSVSVRHH